MPSPSLISEHQDLWDVLVAAARTASAELPVSEGRHGIGNYTDLANIHTALSQTRSTRDDAHASVTAARR